ncbi:replication factor C large subunit [Candidatus Woesearchaeota archaeon]|nr:replication factor C large subunit [Candidatus Woesearchaeota archaeon]
MGLPWIKKHVPSSVGAIVGQPGVATARSLVQRWSRKSKPVWLWGGSGTGKTATAVALAHELGLELVEVNASDTRNKDAISSLIGGAVFQGSLFGTGKLILVDEVDGLSGTKDRGGIPELLRVVKGSPYPVLLTGQDPYDRKFSSLRKACELVAYKPLDYKDIVAYLKQVLAQEKVVFEEAALTRIAMASGGDLRAAVNDAQTFSDGGSLMVEDLGVLGERERRETMQQALLRVFKTTQASVARGAFDNVQEDVDKVMLWADHNLSLEYVRPLDLCRGYDALSAADVFLGRIRRWQHYRFYVYAYDLLTAGVALAKDEKYPGVREYEESDRVLKIWIANQKRLRRKAVAEKLANKSHCSVRRAMGDVPYLQSLFVNDKRQALAVASYLDLDGEEVAWLGR